MIFNIKLPKDQSRYVQNKISIGPIVISLEEYGETRVWTSDKYTTSNGTPFKAMSISSDDFVPTSFPGSREDWLQYGLIVGGITFPLTPRNRPGSSPVLYHINSGLPMEVRGDRETHGEGFIDTENPITSCSISITMKRPTGQSSSTPVVYGYKLKYIENADE